MIFSYNLVAQEKTMEESQKNGKTIYTNFCAVCHMADGKGAGRTFPPVAQADFLLDKRVESIKTIKFGVQGPMKVNGVTFNSSMMPMGLKDEEIADVMNYMLNTWGNKDPKMVTPQEVANIKE